MHRNKQIAIILSDTLRSIGLQSLLTDYFPPVEVCYFPNFEMLSSTGSDTYDYYFTDSDTLVLNADFFLPRRNKTALLIDSTEEHGALSSTNRITSFLPRDHYRAIATIIYERQLQQHHNRKQQGPIQP